jgi:hypothetical protein
MKRDARACLMAGMKIRLLFQIYAPNVVMTR